MNEIEFRSCSQKLPDGTLVLLYHQASAGQTAARDIHEAAAAADAAGLILTFVDPAKPLLIYRTSGSDVCIDFLHDVVYTAQQARAAGSCILSTPPDGVCSAERLRDFVSGVTGRQFRSANDQYQAYADGMLGRTCPAPAADTSGWSLLEFIEHLCSLAEIGFDGLRVDRVHTHLQENRYEYSFA